FNDAVGDISAATGYQSAYIIKEGKTVLGDGGGVCQVSTTLFRAALDAGLTIIERRAHAYRVHYYEEGGYKPGLDATVFGPTVDLKIKNDTPAYILIQATIDTQRMTLAFDLYGTNDGRRSEILNHQVWGITPPPPDLYQDDPTIPAGVIKQVDFAAWGAQTSFRYKVTRNSEVLQDQVFTSNFRPWQAVYLRGTQ
ncbi:VanW family protein, partial [Candidatus Gottesmanbacteria bacterium]|nr:VanW family protein [Candidatus Gottesmanbacteria bacterium]